MSYRGPRTHQEAAFSTAIEEAKELGLRIKIRAKRNRANLPNSYDDIPCHNEKNWKRHRRSQWKK